MSDIIVIKVGGGILLDDEAVRGLLSGVSGLSGNKRIVIVHGGGPQATEMAGRMGHKPRIVNGRRVTTDLDLDLILSTVCGMVNSRLVAALSAAGLPAVGVTGASAGMVRATKRPPWLIDGEHVDFGHVGDIEAVRVGPIEGLLDAGFLPVVSTVGTTESGDLLNINADTTAVEIAIALAAGSLLLVTPSGGLFRRAEPVEHCTPQIRDEGVRDGWISDGMLVKLEAALRASEAGIAHVQIVGPDGLNRPGSGTTVGGVPGPKSRVPDVRSIPVKAGVPGPSRRSPDLSGRSRVIEILKALIRFESVTGSETEIADWVERWAREAGLRVGRFHDNVYCWIGDGPDILLFNSHLDVVPPSADHPYDPFDPVEVDGSIFGRGTVDAKASGAAMLATIGELHSSGWTPAGGKLMVALTACEEGTGKYNGLESLLPHLPSLAGAVVGEPTGLQPCVSQKGLLILKATAHGKSAHAARAALGDNAIEKAARDILKIAAGGLDRVHPDLGLTTAAVTTIAGGNARNVIPDECSFYIDIRTTPSYTHEEIIHRLQTGLESELAIHSDRYHPKATPHRSRIWSAVQAAIPNAASFGSPTVSDWAFLGDTPAVKLGPGDSNLSHTGRENIVAAEVVQAVDVYKAAATSFFTQQPSNPADA